MSGTFSCIWIGLPLVALTGVVHVIIADIKVEDAAYFSVSTIAYLKHEIELQMSSFTSLKHDIDSKIMILEGKINVGFLLFVFLMFQPITFV